MVKKNKLEKSPTTFANTTMERLAILAKNNKVSMAIIMEDFKKELEALKEKGVTVDLERVAVNGVMNIYRRKKVRENKPLRKKKDTTVVYGFITGDAGIWDKAETIRNRAKKYIREHGVEAAIEQQLINGDNNILDTREKIYGRENPKYLQPLKPELHVLDRTMFGFFRMNGEKKYKYGSIQTGDNRLARGWSKVKFNVPCQVTAIVREVGDDYIELGSSSAEDTLSVFKAIKEDMDIKVIIDETLRNQWTEIGEVEDHHAKFKNVWNRRIFVKGIVAWINTDRPTAYGTVKMGLMNPENEDELVIVEIPEQIAIDFGELSELYVFGKTKRSKYYDEDRKLVDGDVAIQATGIFTVVPTPRDNQGNEDVKEEAAIDGWVE